MNILHLNRLFHKFPQVASESVEIGLFHVFLSAEILHYKVLLILSSAPTSPSQLVMCLLSDILFEVCPFLDVYRSFDRPKLSSNTETPGITHYREKHSTS